MIARGVQTWSTDVAAAERYRRAADELGYARITYGDGAAGLHARRRAAGATDLMLGFADHPATGMLERFARDVVPRVARLTPPRETLTPARGDR